MPQHSTAFHRQPRTTSDTFGSSFYYRPKVRVKSGLHSQQGWKRGMGLADVFIPVIYRGQGGGVHTAI